MDEGVKCAVLREMYRIHEDYISNLNLSCRKGCADCCTRHVTMTTLEGLNMIRSLDQKRLSEVRIRLIAATGDPGFRPSITVNGMADRCAAGGELPDEKLDAGLGNCPLLVEDQCSIYDARPFECRAFVSRRVCRESGQAEMSALTINVNNLFRQYIEHIDADGQSGNLSDVLKHQLALETGRLISNRPISVLMIDPEHKAKLDDMLERLNTIRV